MRRDTLAWLRQVIRDDQDRSEHPATDVLRHMRAQETKLRRVRTTSVAGCSRCEELQWLLERIYDTLGLEESDRCPEGVAGYEASVRRRRGGSGRRENGRS